MHLDRRFLAWGVFFVVLGAVPLAVRQGVITESMAREAWDLWPLIIVGIGVGLVLRRTSFEVLGAVIVAATFGLLLGAGIATGSWRFGSFGGCSSQAPDARAFPAVEGRLEGSANVTIQVDCGDLTLAPAAGAAYRIDGTDDDARGPVVRADGNDLEIRSRDGRDFFGGSRDTWRMSLGTEPTYRLDIGVNSGSANVDLSSMRLQELTLSANASEITANLEEALEVGSLTASANAATVRLTLPLRDLRGSLSANAGSIELCAPEGVGLRIRTAKNITASYDLGRGGLDEVGDGVWESEGYASAEVRIELEASANAGSVTLDPEGGCRD